MNPMEHRDPKLLAGPGDSREEYLRQSNELRILLNISTALHSSPQPPDIMPDPIIHRMSSIIRHISRMFFKGH